jgi:hypothetical protein
MMKILKRIQHKTCSDCGTVVEMNKYEHVQAYRLIEGRPTGQKRTFVCVSCRRKRPWFGGYMGIHGVGALRCEPSD